MRILAVALNPTIDVSSDVARVRPTHKMRTHNQMQHAGGGGVNVARVIAEIGGDPELLIISGGASGALLEEALRKLPLSFDVVRTEEATRIAFMVHEVETNLEYRFVPEGPIVRAEEIHEALEKANQFRGDFLIGSGSLPRGAPEDTYARMAANAVANGSKFILDTSGEPLKVALSQGNVFLVKPSIGELGSIVGRKLDNEGAAEAAMEIVRRGDARYIAVTLGRDGAILVGDGSVLRLPAVDVPVKSAVGAGDSFIAALVWFLSEGKTMEEAFRFGVAAGAATVMTSGTELCHRNDVYAIYEKCRQMA